MFLHILIYILFLFMLAYIAISMNDKQDLLKLSTRIILFISAISIIILYFAPKIHIQPIVNPEVGSAVELAGVMLA